MCQRLPKQPKHHAHQYSLATFVLTRTTWTHSNQTGNKYPAPPAHLGLVPTGIQKIFGMFTSIVKSRKNLKHDGLVKYPVIRAQYPPLDLTTRSHTTHVRAKLDPGTHAHPHARTTPYPTAPRHTTRHTNTIPFEHKERCHSQCKHVSNFLHKVWALMVLGPTTFRPPPSSCPCRLFHYIRVIVIECGQIASRM